MYKLAIKMSHFKICAFLLLIFFASQSSTFAQGQEWTKTQLEDSVYVDFPQSPTKQLVKGQESYFVNDGSAIYLAALQKEAYGSNMEVSQLFEFYNSVLKGLLDGMGGGTVIAKDTFKTGGFIGIEVQLSTPNQPQLPEVNFMRVILVNGSLYTQSFMTNAEQNQALAEHKAHFFNSFNPGVNRTPYAKPGTNNRAYKMGQFVRGLLAIAVVLTGIALFIKFLTRPRKSPNTF